MKHNAGNMTVKELRDKLTTMPDDMDVVVYWEDGPSISALVLTKFPRIKETHFAQRAERLRSRSTQKAW